MRSKSVISEAQQIELAARMIRLGARLQMLEAETTLSRERLLKLYKELRGVSPPKGMLPYSTDWFRSWMPNIHSSLYLAMLRFLQQQGGMTGIESILKAYGLYTEHCDAHGMEKVLSLTRAWRLVRFFEAGMLKAARCDRCGGLFVEDALEPQLGFVCGLCNVPSRAGKGRRPKEPAAA